MEDHIITCGVLLDFWTIVSDFAPFENELSNITWLREWGDRYGVYCSMKGFMNHSKVNCTNPKTGIESEIIEIEIIKIKI